MRKLVLVVVGLVALATAGLAAAWGSDNGRSVTAVSATFTATSVATGYECALVRLPTGKHHHAPKPVYTTCSASKTFKHLKHGRYELFVRAVGPSGVSGALTKTFTVKATTKKHHHG